MKNEMTKEVISSFSQDGVQLCELQWEGRGGLCETSPSPILLTKTLIYGNYTDGLKYTARQGITPIMQSWLKLGPHARVLQEHGRSQDVHQGSTEHIRLVNICSRRTATQQRVFVSHARLSLYDYSKKVTMHSLMVCCMRKFLLLSEGNSSHWNLPSS